MSDKNSWDTSNFWPISYVLPINNNWKRLSIIWRIMEIEGRVTALADNTLWDLHNSSDDTKVNNNNWIQLYYLVKIVWKTSY